MTADALVLRGLTKRYGTAIGVEQLDLRVESGELHGFLGRNGAGKTTTMKCIMGLLRPDAGEVELFGEPIDQDDVGLRGRVGFASEEPAFPSYLSGREALETYGRVRGLSSSEVSSQAAELLKEVSLMEAADKRIGKYSRGMKAKLGVAFAMLGQPDLLILDEPTAGLDPVAAVEVRSLLSKLVASGRTVFLSSHQLFEVQAICQRVTVIDRGRKVIEGSLTDLMRDVQGGVVYTVEFDRLDNELIEAVRAIPGVKGVTREGDGGVAGLILDRDWDPRQEVASLAVKYGALMLTCARSQVSLESLFLSLVARNPDRADDKPQ